MPYELIITEKPQAAKKIAEALADKKPIKKNIGKVPYYELEHKGKKIVVASAVGHLFTVAEKEKSWSYPKFDTEWVEANKASKESSYVSKYITALKKLSKGADEFTVATDFDIEGEVIGANIIKYICKKENANRMKFSTLTKDELIDAYENKLSSIVWGQANAGLTRHELDWYYGINLSRALTSAIKSAGTFKVLSSGRVQGPALKILCDREKEIISFKPEKFWQIELTGELNSEEIKAMHIKDKFWDKEKAEQSYNNAKGKDGVIENTEKKQFKQQPPFPFDLTSLQTEAYKCLGIQPKQCLELAQELYIAGLISYPRTSSQKLPEKIGYKKVLSMLSKQKSYESLCKKLLSKQSLKPNNGKKDDPAHPAIYPTGFSAKLEGRKARLYDLIVKRFMACFGEPAIRETITITININSELFVAKGTRTVKEGWHIFYKGYLKLEENEMPDAHNNDKVKNKKLELVEKETQPPKRYTPASIIRELEKRNLGTKATRAQIIDNLYSRGYLDDKAIKVTELGLRTCETLEKYSPQIIDEQLTRSFEEKMEQINNEKLTNSQVLDEAKKVLSEILTDFKSKEKAIGKELKQANTDSIIEQATIGKCPKCTTGTIMVKKGKFGRFLACNNYPECKTTFNVPNTGIIKSASENCKECGYPLIFIINKGRKNKFCINPECPTRKSPGNSKGEDKKYEEEGMQCPECKTGKMMLKNGFYGEFLACNNYPKCKTIMKITNGKVDTKSYTTKNTTNKNSNAKGKSKAEKA